MPESTPVIISAKESTTFLYSKISLKMEKPARNHQIPGWFVVEVRRVELLSENNFTGCSPGADGHWGGVTALFPSHTAGRHAVWSGESHDAWHGQLFPYSRSPLNDALLKPRCS